MCTDNEPIKEENQPTSSSFEHAESNAKDSDIISNKRNSENCINFLISLFFFLFFLGMADRQLPSPIFFCGISIMMATICLLELMTREDYLFTLTGVILNIISW